MKQLLVNAPQFLKQRLTFAALFSLALHAFVLFGIGLAIPDWKKNLPAISQPLEVTLVNSKSSNRPSNATAYAQSNLEGGGNVEDERHAKTPFPVLGDARRFTPEQAAQRLRQLEQENRRLLTRLKSDHSVPDNKTQRQQDSSGANGHDLLQRSLEIARLEAQIDKRMDMYEKMPRRTFIGARTQEYRYAQYVEDWRAKVERIGNLNYPEAARSQKIFGRLTLTVNIRADGSVESVEVNRPSGQRILDAAAIRIVKLAAPYPPFPPDIRKDTDILSITRTWIFTSTDKLESE